MDGREQTAEIARRYLKGWEARDPAVFEELLAPDFVDHMYGQPRSRDELLADAARPGYALRMDIEDTLVEDDRVAARVTSHLTHLESGRAASITGLVLLRIADGKIIEGWGEHDRLGQLQQWGLIPSGPTLRTWLQDGLARSESARPPDR